LHASRQYKCPLAFLLMICNPRPQRSYHRNYTLKGIGKVAVSIPRDRNGDFETQVIPRSKQYEDALQEDLCVMFLSGVSTRTLSLISEKLIGRKICAPEVSNASKQLAEAVETWRQRVSFLILINEGKLRINFRL
jgi:transposase-like protein